jgi:anti-sigma factor RsiW
MNCRKVLSHLSAFLDGEAPTTIMRQIEAHLRVCPSCREQVTQMRDVGDLLDRQPVPPLPGEFSQRVMAEARRRIPLVRARKRFSPGAWPLQWLLDLSIPMRAAACGVVLLASISGLLMSRELSLSENQRADVAETESLDGLEWFSPTPPASLGSAYVTLSVNR